MTARTPDDFPLKILASDMWVVSNFGNVDKRYESFLKVSRPAFKKLIDSLILYDEIVIPTQDFLSFTAIVDVLGERQILPLLEQGILSFARIKGGLAYLGGGLGLRAYSATSAGGDPKAFCAPVDEAMSWALNGLMTKPDVTKLLDLALPKVCEFDLSSREDLLRRMTYQDLIDSPSLRSFAEMPTELFDKLPNIQANETRIYGGPDEPVQGDHIGLVTALAHSNLEILLSNSTASIDSATSSPIGHILKAKFEQLLCSSTPLDGYVALCEMNGVPDIAESVLNKQLDVDDILDLRSHKSSPAFRQWFHANCRQGSIDEVARAYIELLNETPRINTLPVKMIRWLSTTLLGEIPGGTAKFASLVASLADTLFLETWASKRSPKFFIDRLKQV